MYLDMIKHGPAGGHSGDEARSCRLAEIVALSPASCGELNLGSAACLLCPGAADVQSGFFGVPAGDSGSWADRGRSLRLVSRRNLIHFPRRGHTC